MTDTVLRLWAGHTNTRRAKVQQAAATPIAHFTSSVVTKSVMDDDALWDEAFAGSTDILALLADEALADYKAGNTEVLDIDSL